MFSHIPLFQNALNSLTNLALSKSKCKWNKHPTNTPLKHRLTSTAVTAYHRSHYSRYVYNLHHLDNQHHKRCKSLAAASQSLYSRSFAARSHVCLEISRENVRVKHIPACLYNTPQIPQTAGAFLWGCAWFPLTIMIAAVEEAKFSGVRNTPMKCIKKYITHILLKDKALHLKIPVSYVQVQQLFKARSASSSDLYFLSTLKQKWPLY